MVQSGSEWFRMVQSGSEWFRMVHLLIMRRSTFHTGASGRQSQPPNQLLPTAASQGGCGLAGNNRQEKITESLSVLINNNDLDSTEFPYNNSSERGA